MTTDEPDQDPVWATVRRELTAAGPPRDFVLDMAATRRAGARRARRRTAGLGAAAVVGLAGVGLTVAALLPGAGAAPDDAVAVPAGTSSSATAPPSATPRASEGGRGPLCLPRGPAYEVECAPLEAAPGGRFSDDSVQDYLDTDDDLGAGQYLGATLDSAVQRAETYGVAWRVVIRDGVHLPRTDDYDPDRINFAVVGPHEKIVSAAWG